MMKINRLQTLACAAAASVIAVSSASAQVESYSQDFEGMDLLDTAALSSDGWIGSVNVFDPFFFWLYGYFGYPANNDPGFPQGSHLVSGQGDAAQGTNQLAYYSDYSNGDHSNLSGNILETYVYREATISAANVGQTLTLSFDAKYGDVGGFSESYAFFKTLDPSAGWITVEWPTLDLTSISSTWETYSIDFAIDETHVGLVLQYGFFTLASDEEPSTNYVDNVNLTGPPEPCLVDLNNDGFVDSGDITFFVNAFLAGCN